MTPPHSDASIPTGWPLNQWLEEDADIELFEDQELERALKAVSWNALDLTQFLRSCRAQ